MMKGNEAIAESAIRAGARLYAGYPITPSTEIMEYMAWRMKEVGGTFIQAESEIAGINMIIGGAACGVRAITASSGPGMSLKQEGMTVLSDEQLPAVVVNTVRYGNGIGTLLSAQCDYLRETRGGGNGDYRCIVLCPSSVQEAADLTVLAFDLAEKYRMVSMLMTEGALAQMMEPCELPEMQEPTRYPWGFDGKYTNKKIGIFDRNSMTEAKELNEKYNEVKANEQRWESAYLDDAEYVFVAYGLPGRSVIGAVDALRAEGHKVGFIRPITAWPFPEKAFAAVNQNVRGFISVEANATGQLVDDIALIAKRTQKMNVPVYCKPHVYGVPSIKTIKEDFYKVISGEMKEVY
ncbi:3-methyl-2-oxobutanoate dehydrogenase subunit beta [Bacillus sp. FJAT-27245]|uniref:3-methyl-2-oxobutanoate dehydrogenase subunit beta n=1 Tax=Bacillus sp. FJAT-27245 TaxID=1684144 RepID=UPI001E4C0640|nr:3-methyl-2-oxobutanoate dehydrogenase subunit beta [Bacillus sp. FJAT-27245]